MILEIIVSLLVCLTLSVAVADSGGSSCDNLYQALLNQQYGYDETKLVSREDKEWSILARNPTGRRNQILHYTCEKMNNTFRINGVNYQVPDGVSLETMPGANVQSSSTCFGNDGMKEALTEAIWNWELSSFGFAKTTDNNFLTEGRCLTSVIMIFSGFHADLLGRRYQLDADFENDFNALPENGDSNSSAYSEFIVKFGTGYITKGYYESLFHVYVLTPGAVNRAVDKVKYAIFTYDDEVRDIGISDWIKVHVPGSSVIVRTSADGDTISSDKEDLTGGQMKIFGSEFGILPSGKKSENLAKAIEEYIKGKGMARDVYGDWRYPSD